jgi:rhodanese-related sulfurtransferase
VRLISRDELKDKLDRGDDFKPLMTLGDWAYRAAHIPGSLNVSSPEQAQAVLQPDDEIVVYCSNESCVAGIAAYGMLVTYGCKNVRRYAGGLADWDEAGYPLERSGA